MRHEVECNAKMNTWRYGKDESVGVRTKHIIIIVILFGQLLNNPPVRFFSIAKDLHVDR